jgi:hypothetical protein
MKQEEIVNINVSKLFLNDLITTLERVMIILEDNPKIKDDGDFYTGEHLLWEVQQFHDELKELEELD